MVLNFFLINEILNMIMFTFKIENIPDQDFQNIAIINIVNFVNSLTELQHKCSTYAAHYQYKIPVDYQ